jgi:3-dehydroquinate synthase
VAGLYGGLLKHERYILPAGERSKTLVQFGKICDAMLAAGCNRKSAVAALGGGVVGDIAGFAASAYMRGVKLIQIPTTLMAMVDSSIGGKTGVNSTAKNIIGAFHQPSAVLISLHFLKTLPKREILCGVGEIFKTALLDKDIYAAFQILMKNIKVGRTGPQIETDKLSDIIRMCAAFKLDIVTRDEKESNLRKILNVGHTLGHALETLDRYRLPHGEYIIHGIGLEAEIAKDIGLIDGGHYSAVKEYCAVLTRGKKINFDIDGLAAVCAFDKKNRDGGISIVLSCAAGKTEEVVLKQEELVRALGRIERSKK